MSRDVTRLIPKPLAACFARCLRMLDALGQVGRERMAALKSQAVADVAGVAKAFGGLVRAMGLIMLIETRLRTLIEAAASGAIAAPAAATACQSACAPTNAREADARETAFERGAPPDPPERSERLERERFEREAASSDPRSLCQLVAAACRDLSLDREATLRAQAPFLELEALLAGKPPPQPASAPSMDRARPRAPFLGTAEPPDAKRARVDARGPEKPSRAADRPKLSKRARRRLRGRPP